MIDNLTEAIAHAREVAKNLKEIASTISTEDEYYKGTLSEYLDCIKNSEQLAAWLEELQERREADKKLKETLEDMSGRLKDSLFGDGIRFALKLIGEPRKRNWESEDK